MKCQHESAGMDDFEREMMANDLGFFTSGNAGVLDYMTSAPKAS